MRLRKLHNFSVSAHFLVAAMLSCCLFSQAQDAVWDDVVASESLPWAQTLRNRVDSLLNDRMFERSQLGLMIWDLDADSALFRHQERQLMRPASTMKLFTAIAALDCLGPSHLFETRLCYTGEVRDSVLYGDIFCVGGFDPMFGNDDMNAFVEAVAALGIDSIVGQIMTDKSMKCPETLGEGWCWDDDNPVLSPLLIQRKDEFAARLAKELAENGIGITPLAISHQPLAISHQPSAISHQPLAFEEAICPDDAIPLCRRSHTIAQVMERMMKKSDNLYAEAMLYQIAHRRGGRFATAKDAFKEVERVIKRAGGAPDNYRLADGSGLSLYNYVTAELEVRMLRRAYLSTDIYTLLYISLPIAGEDGTLGDRMKKTSARGNVRAKTGTLTGISSLAGYATAPNGHKLCFAIINQGVKGWKQAKNFQDKVCEAMTSK